MNKRYYMTELATFGDHRGQMCVIEEEKQVPFKIARLFYDFFNDPSSTDNRGNHANIFSKFAFICVAGSCEVVIDDGHYRECFVMDNPQKMLVIDNMVWKEMRNFSRDSVLLVISDCKYNKDEYIRSYDQFRELISNKTNKEEQ